MWDESTGGWLTIKEWAFLSLSLGREVDGIGNTLVVEE